MIYIKALIGPDGVGKTTNINKFVKHYKKKNNKVYTTYCPKNYMDFKNLIITAKSESKKLNKDIYIILDRWRPFCGEVYRNIFPIVDIDKTNQDYKKWWKLVFEDQSIDLEIYYLDVPTKVLAERVVAKKDPNYINLSNDLVMQKLTEAKSIYNKLMISFDYGNKFIYNFNKHKNVKLRIVKGGENDKWN